MTERSLLILACAHLLLKKRRLKKNKENDYKELQRVIAIADTPHFSLGKAIMLKLRS